ncbi:MAG: hypothetical protein P8Y93_08280, partial [Acidobacteriota bacterium]
MNQPTPIWTEPDSPRRPVADHEGRWTLPESFENEEARFFTVGKLEAGGGVRNCGRRVRRQRGTCEGQQPGRLGPTSFANAPLPQTSDNSQHDDKDSERSRHDDASPSPTFHRQRRHGRRKRLLGRAQPTGIAPPPDGKLPVRRARPQHVVGAAVLVPRLCSLTKLVAELGCIR